MRQQCLNVFFRRFRLYLLIKSIQDSLCFSEYLIGNNCLTQPSLIPYEPLVDALGSKKSAVYQSFLTGLNSALKSKEPGVTLPSWHWQKLHKSFCVAGGQQAILWGGEGMLPTF